MHHHHPLTPTQSASGGTSANSNVAIPALPIVGSMNAVIGTGSVNNPNAGAGTSHVQQRRRKKRPNYGTRTVEVRRGYNGFGFTISGQQPCRLSCIVSNSPADQAGLRAGDFLISVNGLNVSKLPHETVVQLIGNSFGSIRMQIAENYYSDSSDEENAALMLQQQTAVSGLNGVLSNQLGLGMGGARAKPRYLHHKAKMHRLRNSPQKKRTVTLQQQQQLARAEQLSKCVSALKPMELQKLRPLIEDLPLPANNSAYVLPSGSAPKEASAGAAAASNSVADLANVNAMARAPAAALEYRAIVGYLGTIEMPKQISHSSKLQTVRSCIRKLRQEKRQPNMVLMTILPDCLRLQAANGNTLASYASERLNYVSSSSESENRFFGLVTSAVHTSQMDEDDEDDDDIQAGNDPRNGQGIAVAGAAADNNHNAHISISNSCHVFVVDTKLCEHQVHVPRAAEFRIHCTRDPISSLCLEFPNNSEYVVNLIRSMYTMRIMPPVVRHHGAEDILNGYGGGVAGGPAAAAHSPQPSNHSEISTTTSNSDSGIGFHNDCSNISDRILVVDFPGAPELRMRPMGARPMGIFNNFDNVTDKRPAARAVAEESSPPPSVDVTSTSNAHCANSRPNLLANFNLIKSPATSLQTTRSCDDVLALVERSADDGEAAVLDQHTLMAPHASMDDISLHSTAPSASAISCSAADDHLFLHPAACMLAMQHQKQRPTASQVYALLQDCLSRARNARQSLPSAHTTADALLNAPNSNANSTGAVAAPAKRHSIGFEASDITTPVSVLTVSTYETNTWKSLQDLRENEESIASRTPDGINSEPDLLNPNLPANASPFRQACGQSSFRTPRADKRALQKLQLQQQSGQHQHLSPLVRRSSSMTASDNDVYIKSMHHIDYHDELKQARSQHQIATSAAALVAARNANAVAVVTAATLATTNATNNGGNNKISNCSNQLKIPQLKTTTAPPTDIGVGGVVAWGTTFERLLEDPAGMHTFAEFLKKEFSAENIYFWTACERYRAMESNAERTTQALAIFSKHLANGALEPVNVDSQARNMTQEKLESAEPDIFAPAQKQIFNLMKFDSYQRFIRSDMYKSCLEAEEKRQPLPNKAEDLDELLRTPAHQLVTVSSIVSKLKKSASNAEDRCRKSLLPWHRKTSSNKAPRDAVEALAECKTANNKLAPLSSHSLKVAPVQNSQSDIHSSRSSLSSFDGLPGAAILPGTCRVILSDASTTMVQVRANETVGQLVERLLEKRGLSYQYYDVVAKGTTKSIDLQTSSQTLVGKDVLIEQRVAFKMDLPDRKVISVKSKPKKQLHEVVCPILHKYNYDIEAVQVVMRDTQEPIDLSLTVTHADGQRLQAVWLKPPPLQQGCDYQNGNGCAAKVAKASTSKNVSFPTVLKQTNGSVLRSTSGSGSGIPVSHSTQSALDEITNKVFTELMQVKVEAANAEKTQSLSTHNSKINDHASLKSDDCASETSSIFERIRRRDNNIQSLKLNLKKRSTSSQHSEEANQSTNTTTSNGQLAPPAAISTAVLDIKKPIIAKLKAGVKLQMPERVAENQDELLEGLKRAQLARLEDQRGTEINFELPDFLKNKENLNASKLRKARANLSPINKPSANISVVATEEQQSQTTPQPQQQERPQPAPRLSITNKLKANSTASSLKQEQGDPVQSNALEVRQTHTTTPLAANLTSSSLDSEYVAALTGTNSCKGPPPLPPKPKVLPIKPSNWGAGASMSNSSTASTPTTPSTSIPTLPTSTTKNYTTVGLTNSGTTNVEDVPLMLHVSSKHFAANEIAPRKTHLSIAAEQPTSARCAYLEEPSSSFV